MIRCFFDLDTDPQTDKQTNKLILFHMTLPTVEE